MSAASCSSCKFLGGGVACGRRVFRCVFRKRRPHVRQGVAGACQKRHHHAAAEAGGRVADCRAAPYVVGGLSVLDAVRFGGGVGIDVGAGVGAGVLDRSRGGLRLSRNACGFYGVGAVAGEPARACRAHEQACKRRGGKCEAFDPFGGPTRLFICGE